VEEQTLTARIAGDDPVVVTVLDPSALGDLEARVVDVSSTCLYLLLRLQIPRDAYVLVKLKNYLLFGEVGHCRRSTSGAYEVGVVIEESLCLIPLEGRPATLREMVGASLADRHSFHPEPCGADMHVGEPAVQPACLRAR
jgi:hypothetical protein